MSHLGRNRRNAEAPLGARCRENTRGATYPTARPARRIGRNFGANINFRYFDDTIDKSGTI